MIGGVHAELSRSGLDFVLSAGMLPLSQGEGTTKRLSWAVFVLLGMRELYMEVDRRYTANY